MRAWSGLMSQMAVTQVFAGEEFADHTAAASARSDETHAHGFTGFEGDADHGFVGGRGGRLGDGFGGGEGGCAEEEFAS